MKEFNEIETNIDYEYYISHSGFVDIEPHITMWTKDGGVYYINVHELRDDRFDRGNTFL